MGRTNKLTALGATPRASGVCHRGAGSATPAEGSASLGYVILAANAATCLA